ncbi:MAG: hypothetical protein E6K53_08210 [Gammaproteobacteria bacterium]|nr:MAG: hypothetical protein E6K53_08210 [Gammaproteobacteria bacterium]
MFYWRWFNRRHHPFARLVGGVLGLVLLVGVLTLGFFALVAFAFVGTIVALTRALARAHAQAQTPAAHPHVLEGEYVVLQNRASIKR